MNVTIKANEITKADFTFSLVEYLSMNDIYSDWEPKSIGNTAVMYTLERGDKIAYLTSTEIEKLKSGENVTINFFYEYGNV